MPTSWHYPRWRRILMQLVMVLTLAATTALAAFVSRQRTLANTILLPQVQTVGPLTIRLPAGWSISTGAPGNSAILLRAQEPLPPQLDQSTPPPRQLIVRLFPSDQDADSPIDFLRHSGLLHGVLTPGETPDTDTSDDDNQATSPSALPATDCSVAATDGILVKLYRLQASIDGQIQRVPEYLAAGLLPGGRAIVFQLKLSPEDTDDTSPRLLAAIAAAARVAPPTTTPADRRL